MDINNAAVVTGNLVVGGAVSGVANSLKSKNIETFHSKYTHTSKQVWYDSDCAVNANNTLLVDSITPHPRSDTPTRVQVNGDLPVGSSDAHAENVNSNLHVKTKYLEATAGAVDNEVTVTSDLAMLNNENLKVDRTGKNTSNKITIVDNVEVQRTLTIAGQQR